MAYYLIGTIVFTCYNLATNGLPIAEVTDYYQESLDDIIKKEQEVGAIIPESESVRTTTDDKEILKIVKNFIGNGSDVIRTLFFCKDGSCKIMNADDFNPSANKTDGIIKAQRKKVITDIPEEKINEIRKLKEKDDLSLEATYDRGKKEEDFEQKFIENDKIKSMPKLKLEHMFKGQKYVRVMMNTDPFVMTMSSPQLPKLMKFRFPKTRVPITTPLKPRIFYGDNKVLLPENIDKAIGQYQMYPGAGCVYVKGCDGIPIKIMKSPKAMALIAKIYRELPEIPQEGHNVINFYLQKYEPQRLYVESDEYYPKKKSTKASTSKKYYTDCFLY